jgi:blocked-early-in-transport protein 1
MTSRFPNQQRSSLFGPYDKARSQSQSPGSRPASGYGYTPPTTSSNPYSHTNGSSSSPTPGPSFTAYPNANGSAQFHAATPDSKGAYSDAVLNELESQNEEQVQGMIGKVLRLKDLTVQIGDEIRDSTTLAER